MSELGERLKKYRTKKKLSVSEVARKIGVSPSTYREWEYGRKIKGEPYMKLADVFGVSLVTLLTGQESKIRNELLRIEEIVKHLQLIS